MASRRLANAAAHISVASSVSLVSRVSLFLSCDFDMCTLTPSKYRWWLETRRRWKQLRIRWTSRSSPQWRPSRRKCLASRRCRRRRLSIEDHMFHDPSTRFDTRPFLSRLWTTPKCCNPSRTSPWGFSEHRGRSWSSALFHLSIPARHKTPEWRDWFYHRWERVGHSTWRCHPAAVKASVSAGPTV